MKATLDQLRRVAESLPEGASITLSADVLLEALGSHPGPAASSRETCPDLTVEETGRRFGRAPSTIRAWISAGRLRGCYRLRGREWRVPAAALAAFEEAERRGPPQGGPSGRKGGNLSDWRAVERTAR